MRSAPTDLDLSFPSASTAEPGGAAAPAESAAHLAELERLFAEERGRLLFVALRILQDPQEAEDAVQDGMLSAFRAIEGFRGTSQLSTWLHRVVVNAALMRVRSRKRRRECALADAENGLGPALESFGDGAEADGLEERIDARRAAKLALHLLARQPAGRRQVLEMRLLDGFNNPETAAHLGLTIGAVKLRLCRGRARLRASLVTRLRRGPRPAV